jgi:hypothetical protein
MICIPIPAPHVIRHLPGNRTQNGVAGGNLDKFSKKYGSIHQTAAQKKAQSGLDDAAQAS